MGNKKVFFSIVVVLGLSLSLTAQANPCINLLLKSGTKSFSFHGRAHDVVQKKLLDDYRWQNAASARMVDKRLTDKLAAYEMSFQVKNDKTGNYDKFVSVPVHSRPALIEQKKFNGIVQSTGPVLRALRKLLQRVYSGRPLTAEGLRLQHLPESERELLIKVLKTSIYFERNLIDKNLKDYPFLAVAGFDGAIGDPDNPVPRFFEMNLGTPSGLSNNKILLDELFDQSNFTSRNSIFAHRPHDDTFWRLRQTIESNAYAWTKNPSGISVVISPGIYNGAHPDVAAIARFSGMPLVRSSDLYEDINGNIRLNAGYGEEHPIVTGIYGRMEDSYFLQSQNDKIGMVSPNFIKNEEIGKNLGLKLKNGVIYDFIYGEAGEIVGVHKDVYGQPKLLEVWDTIGSDPSRQNSQKGSFLKAIVNRKLYYSALGGRLVDDKRLFAIVSQYLAKSPKAVAEPVSSIRGEELLKVFSNPDRYVVKEPSNSGGQGIYFLGLMNEPEKEELLQKLKVNPDNYEVQELAMPTTLTAAVLTPTDIEFQEVVTDLRFFVMFDADGEVSAGPNSLLLRTAPHGKLYSNTSRGGGYGVGFVYSKKTVTTTTAPPIPQYATIPISRQLHVESMLQCFEDFYARLTALEEVLGNKDRSPDFDLTKEVQNLQILARQFSFNVREVMDLLPMTALKIASESRGLADQDAALVNGTHIQKMKLALKDFLAHILGKDFSDLFPSMRAAHWIKNSVHKREDSWALKLGLWLPEREAGELVQLKPLPKPEGSYQYRDGQTLIAEKIELGTYVTVRHELIQKMIDEINTAGGEIRYLRRYYYNNGRFSHSSWEPAYFWINYTNDKLTSYMRPVVAVDLTSPGALAALAHEMVHFRQWRELYQKLRSEGKSHEVAAKEAAEFHNSEKGTINAEREALIAEIQMERDYPYDIFNKPRGRPSKETEFGYVNRWLYPEFEAVRRALVSSTDESRAWSMEVMRSMIDYANKAKKRALSSHYTHSYDKWQKASLIELICLPYGIERLEEDKTFSSFVALYRAALRDMGLDDDFDLNRFKDHFEGEVPFTELQWGQQQ